MEPTLPNEELDERLVEVYKELYRLRRTNNALRVEIRNRKLDCASAMSEIIRLRRVVEAYEEENTEMKRMLAERDRSIKGYRRWHEVYRKELAKLEEQ